MYNGGKTKSTPSLNFGLRQEFDNISADFCFVENLCKLFD